MTVGEIIRRRRRELGYTLEEVARRLETSKQTIQRYESGVISNIPYDKIEQMAEVLETTPAALVGWGGAEDMPPRPKPGTARCVPMLGAVACGEPVYAEEEHGLYITVDGKFDVDFCLRAKGDSMVGARIMDGDLVLVRRQASVNNGEIGVVIVDGEATLKRVYYYPEEKKLILTPENPRYAPLVYLGEELEQIRILGKAVAFQSKL